MEATNNVLLHHHHHLHHHHDHHQRLPCSSSSSTSPEVLDSLWMSSNSSPSFHGSAPVVNFDDKNSGSPFFAHPDKEENGIDDYDGCFQQPVEKKRRLLPEQVHFLERSFEVENKLEPERKVQLAKEIGLQPRQVAIWFQNRRARYKTKQLERDYDFLKANYDKLKADYDGLFKENEALKDELHLLTEKLHKGKVKPEPCDSMISPSAAKPSPDDAVCGNVSSAPPPFGSCKQQEDASSGSAKSDVLDYYDSPRYADAKHSSFLDPTDDSSNIFEPDLSDFSQDEDDTLSRSLLGAVAVAVAGSFPKLETVDCYDDLQPNPCALGLAVEEDQGTWFWNNY